MKKKLFSEIPFIRGERLTIKAVKEEDADSLQEMIDNPNVYKYEPSFLFEKRYDDVHYVIDNKKPQKPLNFPRFFDVDAAGFEPAASASRRKSSICL